MSACQKPVTFWFFPGAAACNGSASGAAGGPSSHAELQPQKPGRTREQAGEDSPLQQLGRLSLPRSVLSLAEGRIGSSDSPGSSGQNRSLPLQQRSLLGTTGGVQRAFHCPAARPVGDRAL